MTLSAHQPAYLPWLGYFNKIARADLFVILDDVQFEKNSFINRNKIKTSQGAQWLTIPVKTKGHMEKTIRETEINGDAWQRKHHLGLEQSYHRAPYFEGTMDVLKWNYYSPLRDLGELYPMISRLCALIGIATPIRLQSRVGVGGVKQAQILALCREFGADRFLFGSQGRGYVDVERFRAEGVEPEYQDYQTPEYPQLYGDFIGDLSVVDALFNCGETQTREMICGCS